MNSKNKVEYEAGIEQSYMAIQSEVDRTEARINSLKESLDKDLMSTESAQAQAMLRCIDIKNAQKEVTNLLDAVKNLKGPFLATKGEETNSTDYGGLLQLKELVRFYAQCRLCQQFMNSPTILVNCGHIFCYECLMAHKKAHRRFLRSHSCPTCEKIGEIKIPDSILALKHIFSFVELLIREGSDSAIELDEI